MIGSLIPEKKPTLGVLPKWLHDEQRMVELAVAITLKLGACEKVPREWLSEYNKLAVFHQNRERIKRETIEKVQAMTEADKYR